MAEIKSPLRIVLDPEGADELMLVDWGDTITPFRLPWEQNTDQFGTPEADWGTEFARGGVRRTFEIVKTQQKATWEELMADQLQFDAALPANKELALHIRVAVIPWPASSPAIGSTEEGTATDTHYIATDCVIRRAESAIMPGRMELETRFTLSIGQLELQT